MPRWFRILLVVEACGVVGLAVVGVRLLDAGVHAAGDVVTWGAPTPATPPPAGWQASPPTATSVAQPPGVLRALPGLLDRLDRDTGATATGELALVRQLEDALRRRLLHVIDGAVPG